MLNTDLQGKRDVNTWGAFLGQIGKFSVPEASSSKPLGVLILPKMPSGKKVPLPLWSPRKMMFKACTNYCHLVND